MFVCTVCFQCNLSSQEQLPVMRSIAENIKKTAGGLELTDKHEEMRYRKGIVISSGPDVIKEKQKKI